MAQLGAQESRIVFAGSVQESHHINTASQDPELRAGKENTDWSNVGRGPDLQERSISNTTVGAVIGVNIDWSSCDSCKSCNAKLL